MNYSADDLTVHPPFRWEEVDGVFRSSWRVQLRQAVEFYPIRLVERDGVEVRLRKSGSELFVDICSTVHALDPWAFTAFFSLLKDVYASGAIVDIEGAPADGYHEWFEGAN